MARTSTPRPIEPIMVTPRNTGQRHPLELWFVVLLRVVALLLIARCAYSWFLITGFLEPPVVTQFMIDSPQARLSFLGIVAGISAIAGVGLWLLAAWGALLWMVIVAMDALLFFISPELHINNLVIVLLNAGFIAIYLGLLLLVRRKARIEQNL